MKVIRRNAGYHQQQVYRLLGHNNNATLCSWENERSMPNGANLIRLCILYGKTIQELYPDYYSRVAGEIAELYQ